MKKLQKNETSLVGTWNLDGVKIKKDHVCERIEWLIKECLTKVSVSDDGWTVIYQDPLDKRYWQLSYPQSHLSGGGPPSLTVKSDE